MRAIHNLAPSILFAASLFVSAYAFAAPADDALAWLKSVDARFKQPRLPGLTVEKLATLSEVNLGGHRKSDNKHIELRAADFRHLAALPALRKATLWEIEGLDDSTAGTPASSRRRQARRRSVRQACRACRWPCSARRARGCSPSSRGR
ncbi:MAG: hypothetical protein FJ386_06490 [Verrucomicrobia bacterium]|nr:hypothetical protein [Verrucomicrobiota bacterium]